MSLDQDIKHYCDNCPYTEVYSGTDGAYGAPMTTSEVVCKSDYDPRDLGCPCRQDYLDLLAERDARERAELIALGYTEAELNAAAC